MKNSSLGTFFYRLIKFLVRQACGFTFQHFPDDDRGNVDVVEFEVVAKKK